MPRYPDLVNESAARYGDHLTARLGAFSQPLRPRIEGLIGLLRRVGVASDIQANNLGFTAADLAIATMAQRRWRALFQGAVQAIRNPAAHEPLKPLSTEEAMELLTLASLLNRALDTATTKDGAGKG